MYIIIYVYVCASSVAICCVFFFTYFTYYLTLSSTAPAQILPPQEPTAISVNETNSVSFVCSARGFPAVNITWWYQNAQLMDSDLRLSIQSVTVENNNGFLDTTSTLTISSVNRSDAGNYACVASNTVFGDSMRDMQQFMVTVNCKYLVTVHV